MVCPWWLGYFLINPFRRWVQDPVKILKPWVTEGMTVLEPGPGMGFFTLDLARLVGPSGKVVAVDMQLRMLGTLRKRAKKAGLLDRLDLRQVSPGSMEIKALGEKVDFILAFAVVHEFPDTVRFFMEAAEALKPGGRFLMAEPKGHVKTRQFEEFIQKAETCGLQLSYQLRIWKSHAALLMK